MTPAVMVVLAFIGLTLMAVMGSLTATDEFDSDMLMSMALAFLTGALGALLAAAMSQ